MHKKIGALLVGSFFLLGGCKEKAQEEKPMEETPQEEMAMAEASSPGAVIYAQNCAVCHGETGKGDGPGAAGLNPPPRDFTTGKFKYGDTLEAVIKTISNGIPNTGMTAFKGTLTDEQIRQVAEYVLYELAKKPRQ